MIFIALTLAITYWASKQSTGSAAYFAAGRRIMGWQNGFAIAGDFMSAASFLGVVGLISLFGVDGFVFAWGGLVGLYGHIADRCRTVAQRWQVHDG